MHPARSWAGLVVWRTAFAMAVAATILFVATPDVDYESDITTEPTGPTEAPVGAPSDGAAVVS